MQQLDHSKDIEMPEMSHNRSNKIQSVKMHQVDTGVLLYPVLMQQTGEQKDCYFLNDWQKLWNYLYDDNLDEIVHTLPFLRVSVELIFHHRTSQLMIILYLWNNIVYAITDTLYQLGNPTVVHVSGYFSIALMLFVYSIARLMFFGEFPSFFSSSSSMTANNNDVNINNTRVITESRNISKIHHSHWTSTFKQLYRKANHELYRFFSDLWYSSSRRLQTHRKQKPGLHFYQWLNMTLKFIRRCHGVDLHTTNFNRLTYRAMLLFVIFVFPLYICYVDYVELYVALAPLCKQDYHSPFCQYYLLRTALTLGNCTIALMQYIFASSVLISLIGLAYGGEIAFRLAECWLKKYGCLRRVTCALDDEVSIVHGKVIVEDECQRNEEVKEDHRVKEQFIERRSNNNIVKHFDHDIYPASPIPSHKTVASLIHRDSMEHYLFIRCMMQNAGQIWSPALTGLLILVIYLSLINTVYLFTQTVSSTVIIRDAMFVVIRVLFLVVYPIVSIAFANSYVIKMSETFKFASEDDFVVIGGRNYWLDIFEKFPALWTYHGIYITPERLIGLCWTTFIAFASVIGTALLSSDSL